MFLKVDNVGAERSNVQWETVPSETDQPRKMSGCRVVALSTLVSLEFRTGPMLRSPRRVESSVMTEAFAAKKG